MKGVSGMNETLLTLGREKLLRLAADWQGACQRGEVEAANEIKEAYAELQRLLAKFGYQELAIQEEIVSPTKSSRYFGGSPLFSACELILSGLSAFWRGHKHKGELEKAQHVVNDYHAVFDYLWQKGWRSSLSPDAELPEELLPTYYVNYWNNKK